MKTHPTLIRCALALCAAGLTGQAMADMVLYERDRFAGRSLSTQKNIQDLSRQGFDNQASSAIVRGDQRWEVCEGERFDGRCVVLRPGSYPSLSDMGLNNRISSARSLGKKTRVDERRYAPPPQVSYNYYRRGDERLYEADVTAVRAVVGPPERRCWVERQEVRGERGDANVGGAIAGALIGGILGHQVGGGSGKDIATVGGAVGGAVIGANVGRDRAQTGSRNVERCADVPSQAKPSYWDVTYRFRGQEHHAQVTSPPGNTITVNARGEPRA
jgi:uncharacterized protein YcfJ